MRISATTIDQYRLFRTEEWMSEESLLASIRGEFVPTPEVKAGIAFEKIVERPERYRTSDGSYVAEGLRFRAEDVDTVAPVFVGGSWQIKDSIWVDVGDQKVTVVAKVDHIIGPAIDELKTRWSGFNCDKYMDAHQWRWYLLIFGASYVQYTVACFREPKEPRLESVEQFRMYPYPSMRDDCLGLLSEFVEYIQAKDLGRYFEAHS